MAGSNRDHGSKIQWWGACTDSFMDQTNPRPLDLTIRKPPYLFGHGKLAKETMKFMLVNPQSCAVGTESRDLAQRTLAYV
jgi:hypothetical protein